MEHLFEYETWINESVRWNQGGWIFIKGKPQKDKLSYVFMAPVKYVTELNRIKKSGDQGMPVYMAVLYENMIILGKDKSGNVIGRRAMVTPEYLEKWVGMSGFKIGLNKNKTPEWRDTIYKTDPNAVLRENQGWLKQLPWANLPDFIQ
jgi:hypothetical protein